MRKAAGFILILAGVGLWLLPPTLESMPAQYTSLGTYLHWGGPLVALLGLFLLFSHPRKPAQPPHEDSRRPT